LKVEDDTQPVFERELQLPRRQPEHHGTNLRGVVFEGEVDVPRTPLPAIRDLAKDDDGAEATLDDVFEPRRQLADR
jgi:hypothetical protein